MEIVQHSFLDSKQCSVCGIWKPVYEFYRRANGKYRKDCKACNAVRTQEWREKHPVDKEHKRAQDRAYKAANRDKYLASRRATFQRRYYQDIEASRRTNAEWQRKWRQQNPAKVRASRQAQRARKRYSQSDASFTASEWLALCEHYGNRCLKCGEALPLTPDHIVPVSQGGSNTIDNIQPLCHLCNSLKGAGTVDYRY